MATAQARRQQRVRLSLIPWNQYVAYSDGLGPRHVRVTYDRGEMEIMTLSPRHENRKKRLARLVETLTEEMRIDIASFGSMTCRREDLLRGLEGDECYWVENEPLVRGREDIDLETDPPPDLVLEVEVSRSTLDRLAILAALKVPEVWRWNGRKIRVCLLMPDGAYQERDRSRAFPFLPLTEFARFLSKRGISEARVVRVFRAWVRKRLADWRRSKRPRQRPND